MRYVVACCVTSLVCVLIPNDVSEDVDNTRETQVCHKNGFEFMWYVFQVVAGIMDRHIIPKQPELKRICCDTQAVGMFTRC